MVFSVAVVFFFVGHPEGIGYNLVMFSASLPLAFTHNLWD